MSRVKQRSAVPAKQSKIRHEEAHKKPQNWL
jgi:hypothetical protein